MKRLAPLVLLLCLPVSALAADQNIPESKAPTPIPLMQPEPESVDSDRQEKRAESREALLTAQVLDDPKVQSAYQEWLIAYYERQANVLTEHERAFALQRVMSYLVFFVVHALLGLAVWCASREFLHASKMRRSPAKGKSGKENENRAPEVQEITVSLEGIALKTSFHGTLLLVIALAFYYLFLQFVYPVSVVGQ
ncbi:MAG: hypothetical protein ACYTG0_15100 [Planctomycetota bacterium]|jgi:hypothetical protein